MSPNGKHPQAQRQPEELPEGVEEVGAFLQRWRDPAPDPAAKARLLHMLLTRWSSQAHTRAPLQDAQRSTVAPQICAGRGCSCARRRGSSIRRRGWHRGW